MKNIIIITLILNIYYLLGGQNYNRALLIIKMDEAITDSEVQMVLFEQGFDLDVFEEPTIVDYLLSNLRN